MLFVCSKLEGGCILSKGSLNNSIAARPPRNRFPFCRHGIALCSSTPSSLVPFHSSLPSKQSRSIKLSMSMHDVHAENPGSVLDDASLYVDLEIHTSNEFLAVYSHFIRGDTMHFQNNWLILKITVAQITFFARIVPKLKFYMFFFYAEEFMGHPTDNTLYFIIDGLPVFLFKAESGRFWFFTFESSLHKTNRKQYCHSDPHFVRSPRS